MKRALLVIVTAALLALASAASAVAASAPALEVRSLAVPTYFASGMSTQNQQPFYEVLLTNEGGAATNGSPLSITDVVPAPLEVTQVELPLRKPPFDLTNYGREDCETTVGGAGTTVRCTVPAETPVGTHPALLDPSEGVRMLVYVAVPAEAEEGTIVNHVVAEGGGAPATATTQQNRISTASVPAGFEYFAAQLVGDDGLPTVSAGAHPYQYTTSFALNTEASPHYEANIGEAPFVPAGGDVKDIEVRLPPGLVGNPTATPQCTIPEFIEAVKSGTTEVNECPPGSAVGIIRLQQIEGIGDILAKPIYNLVPPPGMPAQFGFILARAPFYIDTKVRTGGDYGITAYLRNISNAKRVTAASVTFWGTPAAESHDAVRGWCLSENDDNDRFSRGTCPAGVSPKPLLRLPTSCETPLTSVMEFDSWSSAPFVAASSEAPPPDACSALAFRPHVTTQPDVGRADSPTGLDVDVHVPQAESSLGPATPDLRNAVVELPAGLTANPSSAAGLVGCTPAEFGLTSAIEVAPIATTSGPAQCPDASKIGTVEVDTPLVDHPLRGAVFLAQPDQNPFGSLIAIYVAINDPVTGVVVKLAGDVVIGAEGQLTTTFSDNPQLPFEDFKLNFFGGPRASLKTPPACGSFQTVSTLTPWSAPQSGPPAQTRDTFRIGEGCDTGGFSPAFSAGSTSPQAGAYSPFVLHLSREDGSQRFSTLDVTLPQGLTGRLAGTAKCSEAQIAQARARSHRGGGATELSNPSCPASSQIGTTDVAAGAGAYPYHVQGRAYLAGAYKGAPFSLLFVTPAVAGPFDLGTVVVRAGLYINETTAQVSVRSDAIPSIVEGIPLDVRSIDMDVSRPGFALNPTSCNPASITGQATSTTGATAALSSRFQVGGCKGLVFKPGFAASTKANHTRRGGAYLHVVVKSTQGQANIAKVHVTLPEKLPARNSTLKLACTEQQFAANPAGCPAGSVVGHATAHTPLLANPLEGPAIYVSHGGRGFPDLDLVLQGEGITIILTGNTFINKKGITTSTFKTVPDVPVSRFDLVLPAGPHSALSGFGNFCTRKFVKKKRVKMRRGGHVVRRKGHVVYRTKKVKRKAAKKMELPTTITGQNGAVIFQQTKLSVAGCAATKHKGKGKRSGEHKANGEGKARTGGKKDRANGHNGKASSHHAGPPPGWEWGRAARPAGS